MKKPFIYAALAVASVLAGGLGSTAQAASVSRDVQTCSFFDGELTVDIPTNKKCTTTVGVMVNNISQEATLSAVGYDSEKNDVIYQLLQPFTIKVPGADGIEDEVTIESLSSILDPTGSFSISYADFGAPSLFTTMFTYSPLVPTLFGPVNFTGSVSGSLTDGTPTPNGVGLTVTDPAGLVTYDLRRGITSVGSFNLGPSISFPAGPPNTHTYPAAGGEFSNTGSPLMPDCGVLGCDNVKLTLAFTGTGGNDRYAFTGRWDAEEKETPPSTPEPSATAALAGVGLFGLIFLRRRKLS